MSAAIYGEFQELVILGIAASADDVIDGNHFRHSAEQANELLPVLDADIRSELGTGQDAGQFSKGRIGN